LIFSFNVLNHQIDHHVENELKNSFSAKTLLVTAVFK